MDLAAAWNLTEIGPGHVQLGVIGGPYELGDEPTPTAGRARHDEQTAIPLADHGAHPIDHW
ncbi:MAG: hypothetical protein JNL79_10710 [Myxococcales bacterium]|nr:hypothetical protein [Myxococcales bacterium]